MLPDLIFQKLYELNHSLSQKRQLKTLDTPLKEKISKINNYLEEYNIVVHDSLKFEELTLNLNQTKINFSALEDDCLEKCKLLQHLSKLKKLNNPEIFKLFGFLNYMEDQFNIQIKKNSSHALCKTPDLKAITKQSEPISGPINVIELRPAHPFFPIHRFIPVIFHNPAIPFPITYCIAVENFLPVKDEYKYVLKFNFDTVVLEEYSKKNKLMSAHLISPWNAHIILTNCVSSGVSEDQRRSFEYELSRKSAKSSKEGKKKGHNGKKGKEKKRKLTPPISMRETVAAHTSPTKTTEEKKGLDKLNEDGYITTDEDLSSYTVIPYKNLDTISRIVDPKERERQCEVFLDYKNKTVMCKKY